LSALVQDPNDFGAKEAIFELIPPATQALEAAISAKNSGEIERLAQLLLQADPSSTRTVALLERRRAQVNQEQAIALAEASSAASTAPGDTTAELLARTGQAAAMPASQASESVLASVAEAAPTPAPGSQTPSAPSMPAPALASVGTTVSLQPIETAVQSAAPTSQIVDARVIKSASPIFPAEARRRKVTGWVDLKLQIDASGRVTGAAVVGSQPGRIFDAEAKRAVMRWRFSPKTVDSKAVASTVNQRITFNPET
jgi:TonB family protein